MKEPIKNTSNLPHIICLVGVSGAGKDYIQDLIVSSKLYSYTPGISHTTRPMRDGEIDGINYHFVDDSVFSKLKFANERHYNTIDKGEQCVWKYGMEHVDLDKVGNVCTVADLSGTKQLKAIYGDRLIPIRVVCDEKVRLERAKARGGFDQEEWDRRLVDDASLGLDDYEYYLVANTTEGYSQLDVDSMIGLLEMLKGW